MGKCGSRYTHPHTPASTTNLKRLRQLCYHQIKALLHTSGQKPTNTHTQIKREWKESEIDGKEKEREGRDYRLIFISVRALEALPHLSETKVKS